MIRRDQPLPDGSPGWILVTQPDHAQLAAEMAAVWGSAVVAPLWPRRTMLMTVALHDEGWLEWEQSPQLDEQGRPRNFLEMEPQVAQAIWEDSIVAAAAAGPLAQYCVAMHFVTLRARHRAGQADAADGFVTEYSRRATRWLEVWEQLSPENTSRRAAAALAHLQLFDALSLWLCCHARPVAMSFPTPGGQAMHLSAGDVPTGVEEPLAVSVSPWPFAGEALDLTVAARQVPARCYANAADLASAARPVTLRWKLVAA